MKIRPDFGKFVAKLFIYNDSEEKLYYHTNGIIAEKIKYITIPNGVINFDLSNNGSIKKYYLGELKGSEHNHIWNTPSVNILVNNDSKQISIDKGFYQAFAIFLESGRVPVILYESQKNYRGLDDLENLVNRPIIDLDIKDKRLEFYLRKLMIHNIQVWNNTSERKALEITEEQNRSINDEKPVITKDLITQIAVKTNPFLNDENETIPVGFDRFTTFQGQELRRKRDIWDPPITMNSRVINKILISKKND